MAGSERVSLRAYWALAIIVASGAGLRLYHLDHQSLWHDEAISVTVGSAPLERFLSYFKGAPGRLPIEYNPPAYSFLLHVWFRLIGSGGLEARLLSALAGVLSLGLIFALSRRLFGGAAGLAAAVLLAVSQLGVMFSQEARNYEVFLALTLATALLYWVAFTGRRLLTWCGFTLAAIVMVLTHYYGAFVILALALHAALYWRPMPWAWAAGAVVAGAAALAPWLRFAFNAQMSAASDRVQPEYFSFDLSTAVSTINRFNNGATSGVLDTAPSWTYPVGLLLFCMPVLLLLWRSFRGTGAASPGPVVERSATVFALLLFASPLGSVFILGFFFNVQYNIRYSAFCIGPYYMLAGAGLMLIRPPGLRWLVLASLVAYSGYSLRAVYFKPYKENYRDAIRVVDEVAQPGDCFAFMPFGGPPLEWEIYTSLKPDPQLTPRSGADEIAACRRLWVLRYQRSVTPFHARWRDWLATTTSSYAKVVDRSFFWVRVELFEKKFR
jgi:4-amino-4-deoxy-L-arabinose transferase-like glycosyltransferase